MATFHHGISAQELTQGIMPMRNANVSVLGLVVTSTDADNDMYPADTPVLLTGITQDNIEKSGTDGTLRNCLQTIRDIHNPTVVVLRVAEGFDVDLLDVLLTCQSRFGLMPKRLGAPEIDTPDVVLKLVSIAKKRRGIVYASPRTADGELIVDKALITAYRDTYGDRELCIIDGEWGVATGADDTICEPTRTSMLVDPTKPSMSEAVHARYRVNGGTWQDYNNDYQDGYDPMFVFFEGLEHNGQRVFEPTGSGRVAAFRVHSYDYEVFGASQTEPFVYPQESVVQAAPTTIDFKVTDMLGYDLIGNYFGEDTTIKSCAQAKWAGE